MRTRVEDLKTTTEPEVPQSGLSANLPTFTKIAGQISRLKSQVNFAHLSSFPLIKFAFGGGLLVSYLNQLCLRTFTGFVFTRVFVSRSERLYHQLGECLATLESIRAYRKTKAYREFIDSRADWKKLKLYSELPETTKDNYIKPNLAADQRALYVDYTIPAGASWDTSTGTSGKPTSWYRGRDEVISAYRTLSYRARAILGRGSYCFINGFALGPWATGLTAAKGMALDPQAVSFNIGPNPEHMLQLVEECKKISPDRPIVVAGYPPHIEELVRLAREQNIALDDHHILAVVGGEAMSESQRKRMSPDKATQKTGFKEVFSFYGASDLDINIGIESPFAVALRTALESNRALMRTLLGDSHPFVPMVFHYDPMAHLIEVNQESQLVFTELSGTRISPRIRYNLGDIGMVRSMSQVEAALEEHGIKLPEKTITRLPLVFVWGRIDDGITYRGANVHWKSVEEALRILDLKEHLCGFGVMQHEEQDGMKTDVILHIRDATELSRFTHEGEQILRSLIGVLKDINHDFAHQVTHIDSAADLPRLRVFFSDSPMALHGRENPARKQKHVFLGSDIAPIFEIEEGGILIELASLES